MIDKKYTYTYDNKLNANYGIYWTLFLETNFKLN